MADEPSSDSTHISAPGAPVTFFKKRGGKANLRKRPPTPPPAAAFDSDSGDYSSGDEGGGNTAVPAKRRKRQHVVSASSSIKPTRGAGQVVTQVTYAGDTSKHIAPASEDATKRSNWHNETEEEYLIRKRGGDLAKANAEKVDGRLDDAYQGAASYKSFIRKKEDAPSSKGKMGPVKAPTNVRQVVTVDFAPDVCKDYKQTGFCGFGDTCKFLHAREDYKQGWQLDNDWDNSKSGKKLNKSATVGADEDSDPELKDIPFACVICKQEYKLPIVTKCNHYFCEKCAIQRYRKNPGCAICGAGTNGIFNTAKNLQKKLEKKRARAAQKKKEEGTDGEGSDDDAPQQSGFGAGIQIEGD